MKLSKIFLSLLVVILILMVFYETYNIHIKNERIEELVKEQKILMQYELNLIDYIKLQSKEEINVFEKLAFREDKNSFIFVSVNSSFLEKSSLLLIQCDNLNILTKDIIISPHNFIIFPMRYVKTNQNMEIISCNITVDNFIKEFEFMPR